MSNQIFTSATECAAEITKLRAQRVACRLQKVQGGFTIVLMNGKAQPKAQPKAKTAPVPHIKIRTTPDGGVWCDKGQGFYPVVKFNFDQVQEELGKCGYVKTDKEYNAKLGNQTFYYSLKHLVETEPEEETNKRAPFDTAKAMEIINKEVLSYIDEDLHEDDQVHCLDFQPTYRRMKGNVDRYQLFIPVGKAPEILSLVHAHAHPDADEGFPFYQVNVFEKGRMNDLFVSLAVVVTIEDGEISEKLHKDFLENLPC